METAKALRKCCSRHSVITQYTSTTIVTIHAVCSLVHNTPCVCVCVYIYIYIHIYIHIYICIYIWEKCPPNNTVHRCLHVYINIHVNMYVYADWKNTSFMTEVITRKMEEENGTGRQYVRILSLSVILHVFIIKS